MPAPTLIVFTATIAALAFVSVTTMAAIIQEDMRNGFIAYRKVGGIHFLKMCPFQFTFCITRKPAR